MAGTTYRARLTPTTGDHNFDLMLEADGAAVFTPGAVFNTEGRWGRKADDRRIAYYLGATRLIDLVSVDGRAADSEVIGHVEVPTPEGDDVTGTPFTDLVVTIIRTHAESTWGQGRPSGWVVRTSDGGLWNLDED
ncbi:hypothetical protein [Knoellia subterranea]|uniref:hypothetical protein n=1 Tax=Knoellia subterranea TaxID=184882 RepID=UPI000B03D090|nr:hypothetical protein [Knoellia subterranea]